MKIVLRVPRDARVMVLDDDPHRRNWFLERLSDVVCCETAEEAIKTLVTKREPFDLVFLDHDLGNPDEGYKTHGIVGTGYGVAKNMAENGFLARHVVIHSWNPTGAANMARALDCDVKILPFGSFEIESLV